MPSPNQDTEKNKIGLATSTSLVIGNMIASGVFMLPATLAIYGGISLMGWIVSGLGAMCLALVYSWLSRHVKNATGGPYAYTREGLGEFAAFQVAWGYWISIWVTNAAIAVGFVSYLTAFIPVVGQNPYYSVGTGLAAVWFLTWINSLGIREGGKIQVITTVMKLAPLLLISIGGLFYLKSDHFVPFNVSEESDLSAITNATTLTLFAFLGLECATIPSGNVKDPEKTIPRATILGTLITTIVYVLGTVAIMGIIPPATLQYSQAPFADAAANIWGDSARYLIAAGAVVSTFGALNGWIIMQGQIPMAAARDRLFPRIFAKENKKSTPVFSLVISSVLISILMTMGFTKTLAETYKFMILLTTLTVLIPYLFSTAAYAILELRKNPVLTGGVALKLFVTVLAFGYSIWAVVGCGEEIVFTGFILLLLGTPIYVWMKRKE